MVILLALFLALPAVASAAVPSAATSTVPCFVVCPHGDMSIVITVRDAASNPIANSTVTFQLCTIEGEVAAFCDPPVQPCLVLGVTGPDGRVTFLLEAGGVSPPTMDFAIRADGVPLATRRITSPDQNGDLVVNATDLALGTALVGTSEFAMDLDCDGGTVDEDDLNVLRAHLGHFCDQPTPARPGTWGRVKVLYR